MDKFLFFFLIFSEKQFVAELFVHVGACWWLMTWMERLHPLSITTNKNKTKKTQPTKQKQTKQQQKRHTHTHQKKCLWIFATESLMVDIST